MSKKTASEALAITSEAEHLAQRIACCYRLPVERALSLALSPLNTLTLLHWR